VEAATAKVIGVAAIGIIILVVFIVILIVTAADEQCDLLMMLQSQAERVLPGSACAG
jgi:hypothetical protein